MQPHEYEIRLAPGMIDSHLHLSEIERKGLEPAAVLEACFSAGLERALDIGITTEDFETRRTRAQSTPKLQLATGLHPATSGSQQLDELLAALEGQLTDPEVVALGETGIDCFRMYAPLERQRALFLKQLQLAEAHSLPVVVHNRDADTEILAALKELSSDSVRGIMHCFSSGPEFASEVVARGFHVSFAGNLTYKKAEKLRAAARAVPAERVLVETDAPYLAPMPRRGRTNHPGLIGYTYAALAELRGVSEQHLVAQVRENYRALLGA